MCPGGQNFQPAVEAENDSSGRILKDAPVEFWKIATIEAENDSSGRILKDNLDYTGSDASQKLRTIHQGEY